MTNGTAQTPSMHRRASCVSLDATPSLASVYSYQQWCAQKQDAGSAQKQALNALVRELFNQLDPNEQLVLRSTCIEGKSANSVAVAMGVHHSAVDRLKSRAEEKLRRSLAVSLRLQELEREFCSDEW